MSKLVLFLPDGSTLDVPLARERITIGRRADNDVCLPNLAVSGEHAVVVTILADSFLEDLNSTNGTLVNGEPIAKHFLRDHDEIDIGRHKLVYCVDDDATFESKKLQGMARIQERDFGGRVETAKPFVRRREDAAGKPPEKAAAEASPKAAPAAVADPPARRRAPQRPEPLIDPPEPDLEAPAPPVPPEPPPPVNGPAIKLLTGARAGTAIALNSTETTLGRPGVQVASIVRTDASFRIKPLEGISPPSINGQAIAAEGADLAPGDVIEIAGTRVEFVT